jgi:glycerol-3-phosphate dehydrogenase
MFSHGAFLVTASLSTVVLVSATVLTANADSSTKLNYPIPKVAAPPPKREELIKKLHQASGQAPDNVYDILIVGGGATGTGVAVDAASRGLKVALLERDDFSCGTSSRSTKLVHGGIRYLEKAVWNLNYSQYKLVREALHERKVFLEIAPHLSFSLPIMIPVYKWWQLPYFWIGAKAYDLLAGKQNLESSYLLTKSKALEAFPQLNAEEIKGAVVYYDGSHNDARMSVSLALSAIELGATVLNHLEVIGIDKDSSTGKIIGVTAKDLESSDSENINTFKVKAKVVVNATGPFTASIRKLDDFQTQGIVAPSSGVHIILPGYYSPKKLGLLDAATSDGRVIFFLPWQGSTIAGTTDKPTEISPNPTPTEEDIQFILNEVSRYFEGNLDVRREDVLAAWSGIRPLVRDPHAKNTESLVRNHLITVSESGLVTIAGGKWTTYRQMAQETVNECIKRFGLIPERATTATESFKLVGSQEWDNLQYIHLIQKYNLDPNVAKHLSENYGTRAFTVAEFLEPSKITSENKDTVSLATNTAGKTLIDPYPFLHAEIKYAMRYEYATTAIDFLARRIRLAFLDSRAAYEILPTVVEEMSEELGWSDVRKQKEHETSVEYLKGMGLQLKQ